MMTPSSGCVDLSSMPRDGSADPVRGRAVSQTVARTLSLGPGPQHAPRSTVGGCDATSGLWELVSMQRRGSLQLIPP